MIVPMPSTAIRLSGNAHAMLELSDARPPFNMDNNLGFGAGAMAWPGPGYEG